MVEFLRKFENSGIKIAGVNSILVTKSLNLQLYTLILYGVDVPSWSKIFRDQFIYREIYDNTYNNTWSGFEAGKPAPWLRRCCRYMEPQHNTAHILEPTMLTVGLSQGHLQYRSGCTTLCGWLIHSFSPVIKIFLQYFSIEDTHFMNESFIKISRTCVKSQADPGLEL